jgi:hypothetical protein
MKVSNAISDVPKHPPPLISSRKGCVIMHGQ